MTFLRLIFLAPILFLGYPVFKEDVVFTTSKIDCLVLIRSLCFIVQTKSWLLFFIFLEVVVEAEELIYYLFVAVGNLIIIFFWLSSSGRDTFRKKRLIIILLDLFIRFSKWQLFLQRAKTSVFVSEKLKSWNPSLFLCIPTFANPWGSSRDGAVRIFLPFSWSNFQIQSALGRKKCTFLHVVG